MRINFLLMFCHEIVHCTDKTYCNQNSGPKKGSICGPLWVRCFVTVLSFLFLAVSGVTGFVSQIQKGEDVLISGWQVWSVSETGARRTLCSICPIVKLTLIDTGLPQTTQLPFCLEPLWPRSVYRTTHRQNRQNLLLNEILMFFRSEFVWLHFATKN